ncbi:MAG TPA: DDE-type integrase/transposase/recombinase [Ktedonobacterales bacterium]|nr:DDE-type integrase/transposase/recombinase [Ktedonobacterales bacterium]
MSHLLGKNRRRGDLGALARGLGASRRTLHLWLRASRSPPARRVGRPGASEADQRAALRAIACLYRMDWKVSWRSAKRVLGDRFSTRLLQVATARFKRYHARHAQRQRELRRVHVEVNAPDVIWGLDGTHLGRTPERAPIESQVLRDACARRTLDLAVGRPARGEDVVHILERAQERFGALPLVLSSDNGPINTSARVDRYLRRHQIIHLRNVPHTPQHNAFTERGIGELKEVAELGEGVVLEDAHDAARRLAGAWHHLDHRHARPALHQRSAAQCYQNPLARYRMPDRKLFYRSARHALQAASHAPDARARRRAQREAIYATLERFGLVSRTRGGVPFRAVMCERIS